MRRTVFIEKLRKARALLAQGWTQNTYSARVKGVRCYCIMGALRRVGLEEQNVKVQMPGAPFASFAGALIRWNDEEGRTADEVLACIDNSIAALTESSGRNGT